MSYPPNHPEDSYPSPGPYPPQPPQPAGPYPPAPQPPGPYPPPDAGQDETAPSPPFSVGQPTAIVPSSGSGYPQQTSPAPQPSAYPPQPPQPAAYQPGSATVPPYPPPSYGDSYPLGLPPTSINPMVSGPPSVDPLSGPLGYGQPSSGPPGYGLSYGAPMSGTPDYGQAPRRGRGLTITLAILTVVFFLASAVLTGLYVTKSGAYDKKVTELKGRDTTISTQTGQIDDLKKQVQAAKDQLDQANQKQTGTQNQLDEVTKEKQVIGNCLTLLSEAIVAANAGDRATAQSKANAAQQPCNEAQKYLN